MMDKPVFLTVTVYSGSLLNFVFIIWKLIELLECTMTELLVINIIILTQSILMAAQGIKKDFLPAQSKKLYNEVDKFKWRVLRKIKIYSIRN